MHLGFQFGSRLALGYLLLLSLASGRFVLGKNSIVALEASLDPLPALLDINIDNIKIQVRIINWRPLCQELYLELLASW